MVPSMPLKKKKNTLKQKENKKNKCEWHTVGECASQNWVEIDAKQNGQLQKRIFTHDYYVL